MLTPGDRWELEAVDGERVVLRRYVRNVAHPVETYRPMTCADGTVAMVAVLSGYEPPRLLVRLDNGQPWKNAA